MLVKLYSFFVSCEILLFAGKLRKTPGKTENSPFLTGLDHDKNPPTQREQSLAQMWPFPKWSTNYSKSLKYPPFFQS